MTDEELLSYLEIHCRTQLGTVHRDQLKRLFRMVGESHAFLDEGEWWATTPDVIDPMVALARQYLGTRREEAMEQYRAAWLHWKESIALERERMEREMDRLQPLIAESAKDPRWQQFIDTLPGYREWWARAAERTIRLLKRDT